MNVIRHVNFTDEATAVISMSDSVVMFDNDVIGHVNVSDETTAPQEEGTAMPVGALLMR